MGEHAEPGRRRNAQAGPARHRRGVDLRGIDATATQVQHWVDKTSEARVVVVGQRTFTIRITASSDAARVDWRADFTALSYEWIDTPAPAP